MKSTILMGPPGSGKTTMYVKTAINRPVLAIDADRKLRSMTCAIEAEKAGELFIWELDEPLIEEKLAVRLRQVVVDNAKPMKEPKGWYKFADYCARLETDPIAQKCGTWAFDSATVIGAHCQRLITFLDKKGKSTMSPRNWGEYLMMWQETITEIIDVAKKLDKDVIFTVHQRVGEVPGENNTVIKRKGEGGVVERDYIGTMMVKVVPSIMGQFGLEMGAYVEEFYRLDVRVDKDGTPKWFCRVVPDGRSDLRTSVPVTQPEFVPDFHAIWKPTIKTVRRT